MTQVLSPRCCVCGIADARALTQVDLEGGARAVVCGSHALMHARGATRASDEGVLRAMLRDRRGRRDRRQDNDELGAKLTAAFAGDRRDGDRRGRA